MKRLFRLVILRYKIKIERLLHVAWLVYILTETLLLINNNNLMNIDI